MNNIEILENKIQCFRHMQNTLNDDEKELFEDGIQQEEIQAIENLIKENKELKEENKKSLVAFANLLKEKAMLSKDIKELIRDYSIPKGKGMRVMKYDNVPTFINKLQVILNYYNEEI